VDTAAGAGTTPGSGRMLRAFVFAGRSDCLPHHNPVPASTG